MGNQDIGGSETRSAAVEDSGSALLPLNQVITVSLSVAVVIMAETLLAENNFAQKNGYRINDDQELLAFAAGNLVAALTGCCPINGSVSRTAMGSSTRKDPVDEYCSRSIHADPSGLRNRIYRVSAGYVLTAIVISALLGATEFKLAAKLWKVSRTECLILRGAFVGVLLLGTINGVLIGIILSFSEMVIRSSKPARCFVGIQPGHRHFRDLAEEVRSMQWKELRSIGSAVISFCKCQYPAAGY